VIRPEDGRGRAVPHAGVDPFLQRAAVDDRVTILRAELEVADAYAFDSVQVSRSYTVVNMRDQFRVTWADTASQWPLRRAQTSV
jgi:hypothetical protein